MKVAIADSDSVHQNLILKNNIPLFWTASYGQIQGTPAQGFQNTLESDQVDSSFL